MPCGCGRTAVSAPCGWSPTGTACCWKLWPPPQGERRKGYAGALIRAVQEMLLSRGPVRLYAHVAKHNTPSLRTHSACGFQKIQDSAVYIDGSADSRSVTLLFEYPKNISNFGK